MGPKFQEIMRGIVSRTLMLADLVLIVVSFGLAAFLCTYAARATSIASFYASRISLSRCVWFVAALVVCHCVFSLCNLYESKRMSTKEAEASDVLRALTLSTASLWLGSKLFGLTDASGSFFLVFGLSATALIIISRMLLRQVLGGIRKRGRNLHHILVMGTNARAIAFAQRIESLPERGYRVLGFVDNDWGGIEEFKSSGFRIACNHEQLQEF